MLPRTHAHQHIQIHAPRRRLHSVAILAHGPSPVHCHRGVWGVREYGSVGGGHVDRLFAVVGAGEGGTGKVGVEDAEALVGALMVAFDEPGEAGAEEGGGGCNEGFAEGGEGGEGGGDGGQEGVGADFLGVLGGRRLQ